MKRTMNKILKTAAVAGLVMALATCQTLGKIVSEPKITFDSASLAGISFNGVDLLAKITIKNDNPVSIPFPEINWNLFMANSSFLSGVIPKGAKIAANGSTTVNLPITVTYAGLYGAITSLISADETPYRIDLAARFALPLLENKTFTASHSGSIPLIKLPAISFSGVKFTTVSLTKVEFVLTWAVENKGGIALNIDRLGYSFSVNNTPWTTGTTQKTALPGRKTTQVPVTITLNTLSLLSEILSMSGKSVNYICGGEAVLSLQGYEKVAPLNLPFNYSGSVNLGR